MAAGVPDFPLNFRRGRRRSHGHGTSRNPGRDLRATCSPRSSEPINPPAPASFCWKAVPGFCRPIPRTSPEKPNSQLERLGVEVRVSNIVTGIEPGAVWVGYNRIPAHVVLWAAGVAASELGQKLGAPVDRAGRVLVSPDLSIPGHPEVFVIGDLAALQDEHGQMAPRRGPGGPPAGAVGRQDHCS